MGGANDAALVDSVVVVKTITHQWELRLGEQAIDEPSPSCRLEVFGSATLETLLGRGVDLVDLGAVRKPYDLAKLDGNMATRIPA